MTDLKKLITEVIDKDAAIHYEWGEDLYVANPEQLADLILAKIQETHFILEKGETIDYNSWTNDVDRQGGSFTDAEINNRLTGW